MVTEERQDLSISRACELASVTRSGYYRSRTAKPDRDAPLLVEVERVGVDGRQAKAIWGCVLRQDAGRKESKSQN